MTLDDEFKPETALSSATGSWCLTWAFIGVTGNALCGVSFKFFRSSDFSRLIFEADFGGGVGIVEAEKTSLTWHSSVLIRVTPGARVGDENRSKLVFGDEILSKPVFGDKYRSELDLGESTLWVLAWIFIGLKGEGLFDAKSCFSLEVLFISVDFSLFIVVDIPGNRLSTDLAAAAAAGFVTPLPDQAWMLTIGFLTFCFERSDNFATLRSSLEKVRIRIRPIPKSR